MPILNYTTKVNVHTTLGEIHGILAKHGAKRIAFDYDEDEKITAVCFIIDTPNGPCVIRLPSNAEAVQKVLQKQKVKADEKQSERVAWRIVKDWVEAQMAILESEQVKMDEIFLPYMFDEKTNETLYQKFLNQTLALNSGE